MTDEKIIKALKELLETALYNGDLQSTETISKAFDLINRLKVENKQLRVKLDDYERDIVPKLKYSLERANKYGAETEAENIRLLKENETLCSDLTFSKSVIERLKDNYDKAMDNLKSVLEERADHSEAIKEFAKRLNEKASFRHPLKFVLNEEIDNIVKEIIGEQE